MRDPSDCENVFESLLSLLGDAATMRMVEAYAGCRLFVPTRLSTIGKEQRPCKLSVEMGEEIAGKLIGEFAGLYLHIPLAREFRAKRYRAEGQTHRQIAVRLGLTEAGVDKLFRRLRKQKWQGAANSNRKPPTPANDQPRGRVIMRLPKVG